MDTPGLVKGRYQTEVLIDSGGSASVYRAVDITSNKPVALKRSHRSSANFANIVSKEADIYRRLGSIPGIPTFIDAFAEEKCHYLVMSYHPGEGLAKLLDRMSLSVQASAQLMVAIGRILQRLHEASFAHCDIKPDNIMVDALLVPTVIDLGTATELEHEQAINHATPAYMAPEQCRFEKVDQRTDIYALACVWYECLTRTIPFDGKDAGEIMLGHIKHDLPQIPADFSPHAPAVNRLLAWMLAKDPAQRPQSIPEIIGKLESLARRP